ncbi:unnamed protein product [Spodoptera littoralis]|uniref:Uncharacterized protein n=1 Tax=Spodoptera littoralis TaxID=7109 RepID=A0A9P0IAL9_SPOLI|nr:unnamed protein product [Spodoptera littoralis]CAH1642734.1 unnamed protein product [Spodoptera littoralis]
MSDKSFGDCPSRNIVKNPLLSTAVTGLSIEDLTHNAVLIPVAATQGLITGSEHQIGSNNHTLGHSEHDFTNFPSGDSNTNVFAPQTTVSAHPLPLDNQQLLHSEKKPEKMVPSLSKASLNTEDDFDVNEYFARLHGTRYVSAPINSNPDENANLAAEDNLEEINLNDDKVVEPQQSLTADIAQNFSQLPTVLPHVASAVFSSFSNMLSYKSREQTPDDRQQDSFQPGPGPVGSGFVGQNLSVDSSQVAEEVAKDVAPPPKEMGSAGASSFRITSKKRYAQIPGLSSGTNFETLQKIELNPLTKNVTNYFVPSYEGKAEEPVGTPSQTIEAPKHDTYDIFSPKPEANASDFQSNAFNISMDNDSKSFEERLPPPTSYATQGNATIPPPPMFSSQRKSSQSAKSVLPPSVARRIGSNHPVIKPQTVQTFNTENIFVPTFDPMAFSNEPAQAIGSSFGETPSQSFDSQIVTQQPTSHSQDAALANVPSIPPPAQFTQPTSAFTAPPKAPPTQLPPQTLPPPPSNIPTNLPAPPMFAPTQPTSSSIFAPPKLEDKSKSATESVPPNIFAPTPPTQVPPGPIKPPTIGPTPNIGPPTFFSPPPVESTPMFYSTDNKQVQPSQQYVSEPPKPLVEPPKATGAVNYRLNKKRPQYYSGPIEGVGSISNSIKPVIAPVDPVTFHGAMFTPQQPADLNVPSSFPFDLSKPAENEPLVPPDSAQNLINAPTPVFDISQTAPYQHFDITNPEPNTAHYNTAFDLSRPTTENYEPVEQKESKGFGIIGSLKSKLSSIDINKIQHSVTTFFDPAYNDTAKQDFSAQQNVPYANNPYQAQTAQTNLEIFVPGPQQNIQQYPYDYQHQSLYSNNEYYRYPNFQNQGQPAAGHCSNEHHYPSHSQHPKTYDNSQHGYGNQPMNSMFHSSNLHTHGDNVMTVEPTNVNNSNVMTYKETQDFNAEREMDENVARAGPEVSRLLQSTTSIEERFATNFFDNKYATAAEPIKQADETPHNIPPIGQDRTFTKDSFEPIKQDAQVAEPVAMFNPNTVNLFANLKIDSKDDVKQTDEKPHNIPPIGQDRTFTKDSFEPIKQVAQVAEPVAMFNPNTVNLFANLKIDSKDDIKQADDTPHNIPPIGQDRTFNKDSFEPIKQDAQVAEPVSMFNPNTVNLFANFKVDSKDDSNEKTKNIFTNQSFKGEEKQNISTNEAQSVDLFANIKTESEEKESKLFPAMDTKASVQSFKEDTKPQNLFPFEKKEITSSKDNLLDSLTKDDGMILGVSSVPLFGLSPMVVEQSKDAVGSEIIASLPERNASTSFFEHSQKLEDYGAKHADVINSNASFSFFENIPAPIKDGIQELVTDVKMTNFFDNSNVIGQIVKDETLENNENFEKDITADIPSTTQEDDENASELSICETCREVNKPEDKEEDQDVTSQLIENITAPIQLSNPVEATLTETPVVEPVGTDQETFNAGQFEEISHITEETIETIQVQSAIELLDDVGEINPMNYGWNESALKEDYNFNIDNNQIGFFGKSSLFFDKGAATEEIENEKNMLVRQMSVPSAPPAEEEEDSKSDETGVLDVNSIEQDAKKDFPLFEEFVIEPSENDDDNFKEQERSEGVLDSFTDRIEKYKSLEPSECGDPMGSSFFPTPHPIGMSSYFDTGNYAVEAHYRNTNTRPAPALSIPPGFEEEYKRRLALAKQREENLRKEMVVVPDTSTQTKTTSVATYCASRIASSYNCPPPPVGFNIETNLSNLVRDEDEITPENLSPAISQNVLTAGDDKPPERSNDNETKLPEFVNVFGLKPVEDFDDKKEKESSVDVSKTAEEQKVLPTFQAFGASKPKTEEKPEEKLPDPINFFSDATTNDPPESFSRLASYFSSPPKTDHAKSFFELSQSQNHYRHATSEQKSKINDLIKDLTSVQNISPNKDQIIKHVNYFTVEYDTVLSEFKHGEVFGKESADLNEDVNLDRDFINCRHCTEIVNTSFTVRTAVNTTSDQGTNTAPNNDMESQKAAARGSVTVSFDGVTVQEDNNMGILSEAENRSATEYSPVQHHWFYRVDVEDKSIWRGFSVQDSRALEDAFLNPNLTENTMVATDGGRYDVNIVGRLRIPVYWTDKPTNVRRCSWFYKGTTDARYVPYTEAVAEKLEEEYRHGMTTAEWHRRLVLPNGEVVVMHGPSVMVHFLHSENAFSTPPQSSSRPRVVRRGHDESEIEDTEPSSIDHLLLLCHGVGSACDMRFRSVEEVVEDFRTTSLQLIQSHYRNSYDQGIVSRVEVLPISWHATLHSGETGVDRRLSQITLDSIPRLRSFTNETVLDVLFYTSPVFCQTILDTVCKELNRIYELFLQRNPDFKGGVSLGGHSLGSVILYDLLCHQNELSPEECRHKSDKNYVHGPAGTGQPAVRYPQLDFAPAALYALGSPIAIFECIRGVESLGASFSLPTCKNFFNIFHPYDPIAYRIEPLINPVLRDLKPYLIPHHKGRKRMHLELKDTMARVGADLKQKLLESLRSTWNKWKTQPTEGQLEKVVEEELEKEQLTDDSKEEMAREKELSTPEKLGRLNGGRRIDYVLQEAPLEMINEYLFAMSSHVGYWESEDTMLLILREIYSALGVQPDSTVPQQNMTVQRTRPVKPDETIIVNNSDFPSTSRGPI